MPNSETPDLSCYAIQEYAPSGKSTSDDSHGWTTNLEFGIYATQRAAERRCAELTFLLILENNTQQSEERKRRKTSPADNDELPTGYTAKEVTYHTGVICRWLPDQWVWGYKPTAVPYFFE